MNHHLDAAEVRARTQARLRRGMYLLPSFFTAGNIGLGYFSITQTFEAITHNAQQHLDLAAIAILFAIPFDALDGRIARMTNTASDFGKELDSLADVITFGVAPSLLAFVWGFHFLPDSINVQVHEHLTQAGAFICFLFLLSGASRLARFNISHDAQPRNPGRPGRKYFVGMPIPAAAGMLAATVHFFNSYPVEAWWFSIAWLILVGPLRLPDGQHMAILVGQGAQSLTAPPLPVAGAAGPGGLHCNSLFQRSSVYGCVGVYVLWYLGQGRVLLVASPANKTGGCGDNEDRG